MDQFADIRPYNDSEVAPVLQRLLADAEFIEVMTGLRFKQLARPLGFILRPLVRFRLGRELAGINSVAGLQDYLESYMSSMIADTTSSFSSSGLESLDPGQAYVYMSNHRDITMDPAFTNFALYHQQRHTARIAIGDNLLTKPYVSDLMRLNKSFIVKRSARGARQVLKAYQALSAYIRHSICVDQQPIWIAQREGRAKNGVDRTEPAIIKMLAMSRDKQASFAAHIDSLHIVPVSISYELDPCDAMKAAELFELSRSGIYQKAEHEDVASIAIGITGAKGHVHVAFGTPIGGDSAEQVAAALDQQVIANYQLHSTNVYAYRILHGDAAPLPAAAAAATGSCSEEQFRARIDALPQQHREFALAIYANSVVSKLNMPAPG